MHLSEIETISRIFVGLYFFIFGWNGFFKKIPIPAPSPKMGQFLKALEETNYLMTVVKILEITSGGLLLLNYLPLLAIYFLAPLIFVIVSSQLILNREKALGISLVTLIPYLILVSTHYLDLSLILGLRS